MVVITLALMFSYSLELSLIALASTFAYAAIQFALYKPIRNATEEQIMYGAKQDSHFLETLRAMQAIKIFGKEGQRHQDWSNKYVDSMNAGIRLNKINIISGTVQGFLTGVEGVVIVWVAGSALLSSSFSVGMFFAFMAFRARFSSQVQGLLSSLFQFLMVRLHLHRIADLALQEREKNTDALTLVQAGIDTSISLQKLDFRYSESEGYILKNLELDIKANECVAIAGASGVGKTTLLKVMMGLLEPSAGKVLVAGKPLHHIGLKGYRAITAAVMQNDQLLAGSILQNICFFDIEADLKKAIEAAKTAYIWDEIEQMPMGLYTYIGDMGSALSGGQQQRILLARALYKEPKILFMDEGTSHLDILNEQCINQAIQHLKMTRIIIAHRQETLQLADRVLYLSDGKLSSLTIK
ncbi:ATP-binding cassette domain-containing protein [SAR92 clade bacterium H921]|nr:ATP-binding cassette domain-containing protein [SAR92 clade bacterium H921]